MAPQAQQTTLTDDQLTKATEVLVTTAAQLIAGNTITDDERGKATRLYGRIVTTKLADGSVADEDVVRNNAVLMIVAGAGFPDVIKYMLDCMTGNPVSAGDTLDDDPDLLDDLGGTAEEEDPDLATPAPKAAAPAKATTAPKKAARQRGGVK